MLSSRAAEAVIWGMPAVNFQRMYSAFADTLDGGFNQILYWSTLPDWRNQTLTPNPDTTYYMPFFDTTDGPVVIEIPPSGDGSITGSLMDSWQCALADVGPAGTDRGDGGRYLILPPDHAGPVPPGYIALHCDTYRGYGLCRSNVASSSEADVARAVAYGRRIALYPLVDDPPPTVFRDAAGVDFDCLIPYDARFFESLNAFIQAEPWLVRDKAMIHQLETLGMRRGQPFEPDDSTVELLTAAARDAHAFLDARYASSFDPPFFPGTAWAVPASPAAIHGQQTLYADPDAYPVDDRAVLYSFGFFSAKNLGGGQFYLMTVTDADGVQLNGARSYRLRVPPEAPVRLYWSATAYDRNTHGLIRGMARASRASNSVGLQPNTDGSIDLYFGPNPPDGGQENWIPTDAAGDFEVLFRFYGPTERLFDKSWQLVDIEPWPP
ncbi:DUF1254 domain-containing protein [Mycobacterium sp. EPa45]|uniref:DUF1254 domain-containing protein n=1 Tax=Mycobacterium sp. EPa45 TaxID=1545728 RepID=UPI000641B8FC|nr:DUF1254 domain-containing protein [Mycobacterium sp. EPa45]AKK29209.1 hypothetical protein AB431_23900 [Mycobacterium sp. EPa45]